MTDKEALERHREILINQFNLNLHSLIRHCKTVEKKEKDAGGKELLLIIKQSKVMPVDLFNFLTEIEAVNEEKEEDKPPL